MKTVRLGQNDKSVVKVTYPVLEMSCAACAVSVESMLKATIGVKNAAVNYANQTALVEYDTRQTQPNDLQNAVRSIGYDLVITNENPQAVQQESQRRHYDELKRRTLWSSVLSIPVVILGMFLMDMPYGNYVSFALAAPVVFYFGRSFFVHAWQQAQHGKANMDTLVALSTGIAFLFSAFNTFYPEFFQSRGMHAHVYYEAATVIIAFISLGKLLEERAKTNAGSAIKKLIGLQPKTVWRIDKGIESEIPIASVKAGDELRVKPGEKIPVDGLVVSGNSFVDESMISGEPIAVAKKEGDSLYAGTLNQKGSLHIKALKVGGETVLAQIIKTVQEAQGSKAPIQKLVDKIAGIFVPVVVGISLLTFTGWMVFGGENSFTHALLTSITVLVIACPCALGLATPTAIMVGVGRGAENNILIKDAEGLEIAHRVNAIVLDKTGTITEGKPVVTDAVWTSHGTIDDDQKRILLSMESRSEHPLAQAVVEYLADEKPVKIDSFESVTGKGVKAKHESAEYYLGNEKWMNELGLTIPHDLKAITMDWQQQCKTVVYFAVDVTILAVLAIADKIKPTSKSAVESLRKKGIYVYMLTGDHLRSAESVAAQVEILHVKAEVLPSQKAEFIKELQAEGKIVAMVGDGINDSEALALADVSIAMGKGSDIAMDTAKMTLTTSDLSSIPKALNLSKKTVRGIRQNLFWAFVYNLIGIPIAAGVLYPVNGFLLDPMVAGGAMALSSVSVVANSLRLKFVRL